MARRIRRIVKVAPPRPAGCWQPRGAAARPWRWTAGNSPVTQWLRCDADKPLFLDLSLATVGEPPEVRIQFGSARGGMERPAEPRWQPLAAQPTRFVSWAQAPRTADRFQIEIAHAGGAARVERLDVFAVRERCAKSHALANIPLWSSFKPAFALQRVLAPVGLAGLRATLDGVDFECIEQPGTLRQLARAAIGGACIIDPEWVSGLKLRLADLRLLAQAAYIIIDLSTLAAMLSKERVAAPLVSLRSRRNVMAGRIEYSDVATRGLALQDVVPYGSLDRAYFRLRYLRNTPAWRAFADESGFATLISSETPDERSSGHVLSAAKSFEHGELIATDLPWIVAGKQGAPLAPQMAAHLLRMMCNAPLADGVQNWSEWDDSPLTQVLIRDIADLARRYAPLQTVRWGSPDAACLGLTLPGREDAQSHLVIRSGRADGCGKQAGIPPEPLMGVMKMLARDARGQTAWWRNHLAQVHVTWQFEARCGLKYAVLFDAAHRWPEPTHELDLRPQAEIVRRNAGLLGDGSIGESARLTQLIRERIEAIAAGGSDTERCTRSA